MNAQTRTALREQEITAVLVTRGDVDMTSIINSLPTGFQVVLWDNSQRPYDAGVFGRYVALAEVETEWVFFQDDDCLLAQETFEALLSAAEPGYVVGNAFDDPVRLAKYHDTTLLGWGAIFQTHLPQKAFAQYERFYPIDAEFKKGLGAEVVFPMLTPSQTITHGVTWLDDNGPVLERENRMWKQPDFYEQLDWWLTRARHVRGML